MKKIIQVLVVFSGLVVSTYAGAYLSLFSTCYKPIKPFCMKWNGDTSDCSSWQISSYEWAIEAYERCMERKIDELKSEMEELEPKKGYSRYYSY